MTEEHYVSRDGTRAAVSAFFGVALYEGVTVEGTFTGNHVGVVADRETAVRWVDGDDVPLLVVYPTDGEGSW